MKTYAYIAAIALSALLAPTSVVGYESKLTSDEQETSNIRRKLSWGNSQSKRDKYLSIYCRCCGIAGDEVTDPFSDAWQSNAAACNNFVDTKNPPRTNCACPNRADNTKPWWAWWYKEGETTRSRWNDSCESTIARKAGITE